MAYLTDETMDEIGYEIAQYAAMDGRDDTERFVSESDFERVTECDHYFGEWRDYFGRSEFECSECGFYKEVSL